MSGRDDPCPSPTSILCWRSWRGLRWWKLCLGFQCDLVNHGLLVLESSGRGRRRGLRSLQLRPGCQWDAMWLRGPKLLLADEPGRLSLHRSESGGLPWERGDRRHRGHGTARGPPHLPLSCPRASRGPRDSMLSNGRQISGGPPTRGFYLPVGHQFAEWVVTAVCLRRIVGVWLYGGFLGWVIGPAVLSTGCFLVGCNVRCAFSFLVVCLVGLLSSDDLTLVLVVRFVVFRIAHVLVAWVICCFFRFVVIFLASSRNSSLRSRGIMILVMGGCSFWFCLWWLSRILVRVRETSLMCFSFYP